MSNVCPCVFVEDGERKEMIFMGRTVRVTHFDEKGHFATYVGVLEQVDRQAVYIDYPCTAYFYWKDIIDIQLID